MIGNRYQFRVIDPGSSGSQGFFSVTFIFSHGATDKSSIVQNDSNYSTVWDTRSNSLHGLYTTGLLLYAGSFKLDIFGSDSIKISAAVLPRDKCCTKITVAADLVPKVQYILRAPANTPKRCTYYPDTIARTTSAPAGYCVNQIAFRLVRLCRPKFPPSSSSALSRSRPEPFPLSRRSSLCKSVNRRLHIPSPAVGRPEVLENSRNRCTERNSDGSRRGSRSVCTIILSRS